MNLKYKKVYCEKALKCRQCPSLIIFSVFFLSFFRKTIWTKMELHAANEKFGGLTDEEKLLV